MEVTKVTSETFVTVNAADVVIENSGQNNQPVSRKIAKVVSQSSNVLFNLLIRNISWQVVFIKEYRHSRRAIGCLRPWPYGQNSAIPKWALFVPRDHRVPRLKIPFTAEVASCFAQPPSMLYLAQIGQWDDINHPQGLVIFKNHLTFNSVLIWWSIIKILVLPGGKLWKHGSRNNGAFIRARSWLHSIPRKPTASSSTVTLEHTKRRVHSSQRFQVVISSSYPKRVTKRIVCVFRKDCIFTIDPSDARDLDDAVCGRLLRVADDGTRLYNISVHIADVSFFVNEGTALDVIASRRATSNYLVDRVSSIWCQMAFPDNNPSWFAAGDSHASVRIVRTRLLAEPRRGSSGIQRWVDSQWQRRNPRWVVRPFDHQILCETQLRSCPGTQ